MKEIIKKIIKALLITACVLVIFAVAADVYVAISGKQSAIYERIDDLPQSQAVLVLGAAVYRNGQLSAIFYDRASMALEIYRLGKVKKILVSGDHSVGNYDEVNAAKKFFLKNGVPGGDLFVDYAGFDTYSSIYRAKNIFQVSSLIISTQDFHLPRALFIARSVGVEAVGINADLRTYNLGYYNVLRENGARAKAFWDVATNTQPRFLGSIIPITGDGRSSWD
ncbi:MAG: ElyC/SanA/YdcF family protein [Candidatus Paceibacterota bacterium]